MYGRIPHEGEELRAEKFEIKILKREQSRLDLVSLKRLE
jgi:CBS domain containing-hemolysin-like protein